MAGLFQLAIGQCPPRLLLHLSNLALAILGGFVLRHTLTADVADAILRGHRQLALGFLDALHFGQMPVGLGVERVDVLAVLGQRLRERLALGGQNVVLDPLHVGAALLLGLALPCSGVLARLRFLIDQAQRFGGGLTAQRRLLGQRLGEQLGGLGDLGGFGLLGALQFRLLLVVAAFTAVICVCRLASTMAVKPL